jgi:ring-1,2-phenylacetyl-CoA epoxidase subunit PaaC
MTMQDMLNDPLANIILMHADDKLMLGHIQSDWTGLAPILEEDIAASSMSQDDLSHALVLYEYLGKRFDLGTDEIAFERDAINYRCCDLITTPDEFDWAVALTKRWLVATFAALGLDRLATIADGDLAARCKRLIPEQAIHVTHLTAWMIRLGSGTDESKARMQTAVDTLSASAGMMFEVPESLAKTYCGRDELFAQWHTAIMDTLTQAGLSATITLPANSVVGGRCGVHADHFTQQQSEMTEVRRTEPAPAW